MALQAARPAALAAHGQTRPYAAQAFAQRSLRSHVFVVSMAFSRKAQAGFVH